MAPTLSSWEANPYPILVAVSRQHDIVTDTIVIHMLQSPVSIGNIALRTFISFISMMSGKSWRNLHPKRRHLFLRYRFG